MNPAETTAPLYPTETAPHHGPSLQAWRDGAFGDRYAPSPYGQRQSAYDNGIFGHGLGDIPSAEEAIVAGGGEPRAYRDGLFNRMRAVAPPGGLVTAFRDGIFDGAVGDVTITTRDTDGGEVTTIEDDMAPIYAVTTTLLTVGLVLGIIMLARPGR